MAEGSETPNGEQGTGPEGRPRRSEGDLLAERRARRAAESGEVALTRRAEAAEATLQTLERHVASLQQRLREAEEEHLGMAELVEAERVAALEREHELRRVKQREYAEQQLRVEAEERLLSLDRESCAEIERLSAELSASERAARELTRRLEGVQRQLSEVEQAAAAERATVLSDLRSVTEQDLHARLTELERRALDIQSGLDAERAARERSERLLMDMRQGHRRMESLLGEMKGIVATVPAALAADRSKLGQRQRPGPRAGAGSASSEAGGPARGGAPSEDAPSAIRAIASEAGGAEMSDALAAAVERLRARAEAAPPAPGEAAAPAPGEAAAPARPEAVPQARAEGAAPAVQRLAHKHSKSWIARQRIRRKQRRAR